MKIILERILSGKGLRGHLTTLNQGKAALKAECPEQMECRDLIFPVHFNTWILEQVLSHCRDAVRNGLR